MRVKTVSKRDHAIVFHLEEWEVNEILKAEMIKRIYNMPSLVKFMDEGWEIQKTDVDRNGEVTSIAFFFHSKKEGEHSVD